MIIYTKVNWSNIMWDMKNLSSWLTVNAFWFRPPLVKPHRVHVCDKSSVYCPDQALKYTCNLIALLFTCTTVHHCQKFHCLTKSIVTVIQVLCFTCTSTFFSTITALVNDTKSDASFWRLNWVKLLNLTYLLQEIF